MVGVHVPAIEVAGQCDGRCTGRDEDEANDVNGVSACDALWRARGALAHRQQSGAGKRDGR
jgi:hypothetical protein